MVGLIVLLAVVTCFAIAAAGDNLNERRKGGK
jgi:hypothetical protein